MKKLVYALLLPLVVVSGIVFANRGKKNEGSTKSVSTPRPLSAAEREAAKKEWEATPAGMNYKKWEASPVGKKVYAREVKIRTSLRDSTNMEAVVTSLSLPPGSRLGFGVMVRINGDDYILGYGPGTADELQKLNSLKVADNIIIRSKTVSHAPKYSYPIIWLDYVERDGKVIYKRVPRKGGC